MVDSHIGLSPPIFVCIDLPAPSLQPEGRKFEWPDFGLTRPLNNDKRCAMLSKSSQVSPHGRWSRPGAKISTDQKVGCRVPPSDWLPDPHAAGAVQLLRRRLSDHPL